MFSTCGNRAEKVYDRVAILRHQFISGCALRESWIIATLNELMDHPEDPRAAELIWMINQVHKWFQVPDVSRETSDSTVPMPTAR